MPIDRVMAVPRPVIIAVIGIALISGVFMLMRGQSSGGTVTPAPTTSATPPPKVVRKPAAPPARAVRPAVKPQAAAKPHAAAPAPAVSTPVEQVVNALSSGHVVVILFSQPGSADDDATRAAVASVAKMHNVSVFEAGIAQLSAYRPLLSGVAVSQVPAVVVARSGVSARLIEGYVDPGTLRQTVADEQG